MKILKNRDYDFYPRSINNITSKDIYNWIVNKSFDSGETSDTSICRYSLICECVNINRNEKSESQSLNSVKKKYEI